MPAMCKARQCRTARGDGFSAFTIPDPKKNKELCRNWLRNLAQKNDKHSKLLDIRTFKFSPNYIVCEKHFEPICFQENLKAKYLPGYKQVYKHLKPDAVPTIFADSKQTKRRLHTEQRIAKKERQELVAKLIEEYDKEKAEKEKAEKEKETKNSDNGSENTKDTQTEVDNATNCNDNHDMEHNGVDTNNDPHDKPSVYIDTAEPYSMDINATTTGYTDVLSTSFNILPNFDADNYAASANKAFESVFSYMESEQAANNAPTADSNTNLNGKVNFVPCSNLVPVSCTAGIAASGDQFIPQTESFIFNLDDSVGIDSTTTGSGNCKRSVRPGRIDRTSPDSLSLIPPVTVNSIVSNSEQSGSQRNKKRKKNPYPIYEYTEPKYKEIGIQVSVETCDKGVECDIPLDHTNSASCANCFARENPALAMSDHKYSFRTDSQGRRVSKSNYHPKKKGSALAAIIQRLSNIDQREPEATINELARTEIETETATNDLCEASTENKGDQENPALVMEVNEESPSIDNESSVDVKQLPLHNIESSIGVIESPSVDNESSVDVKEAPLEGIESTIDVIESPSVDNESSVDVKEEPLVGIESSVGVKEPPMGDSESSKDVIERPFDDIESSIGVIQSPSVDNESSVDVKEAPLEGIESTIDVIERLVDIGSSLENPKFVVYENPPSVQEGSSTDVEEPSLKDCKQSVKDLTNLETDARSLDNSDEIGNNFVSGQTVGDLRIPIGDAEKPRNLSQTCSGAQENHSKIPVDNTKDPLYQVETVEYQTQNPAFTPDTVVCDAVIPMDDCVIQLNETMEDATSCDSEETAPHSTDETVSVSEKKIPQRKAFKKTIIPRMIHRYGKKSGTGEYITGSVNSKSTPRHSGIFNTHMSHLKPQIWQSESHTKQLETQQWQSGAFQNIDARPPTVETARIWRPRPESYTNQFETQLSKPWQLVTNHNTVAKPPPIKKTKTHFSEILKEFNTRLNSIETDVVGLVTSNNKPVSTITSSTEQAIP